MLCTPLLQLLPNGIELGYIVVFTVAIDVIGNSKLLLERAGLTGSAHLIGQQVSTKVVTGTAIVDAFQFTAGAINLIIWGATGLIIYSALQSGVQTLRTIQYERDFDSARYIHPRGFTHRGYWREVLSNAIIGFIILALFAVFGFTAVTLAIPDSFAYIQRFIIHPSLTTVLDPFFGCLISLLTVGIMFVLVKLIIRHHRLTQNII